MSAAFAISNHHCTPVAANDNFVLPVCSNAPCRHSVIPLYPKSGPKIGSPNRFIHGPPFGARCARVYDAGGALVHVDEASDNTRTDYISGPMGALARYKNGTITYLHNDHLGSAQSGTTASGSVAWRERYSPFGSELVGNAANDNQAGFTGHIKDGATGLNYMQARYYDPVIGRFLSMDPVDFIGSGGDPRYFNRYSYTANDPINMIDPDGEQTVTYGSNVQPKQVSPHSLSVLKSNARANGISSFKITSAGRSTADQARIMHGNLVSQGQASQLKLYNNAGDAVVNAGQASINAGDTPSQTQSVMLNEINSQKSADPTAFKHTTAPSVLQAIDIAPSSIPGNVKAGTGQETGFVNSLEQDPRVSNVLHPGNSTDPAIHVEIPQPQNVPSPRIKP